MAFLLLVACAVLCGLSAWVLLGNGTIRNPPILAWTQLLSLWLKRFVETLAHTVSVNRLLSYDAFQESARALAHRAQTRRHPPSVNEAAAWLVLIVVTGAVLGGLFSRSIVGAVMVPVGMVVAMKVRVTRQRQVRARQLAMSMPGVLRTMATALESGYTLVQAVEYVGLHERSFAAQSFARASLRLRCGMSVDMALDELSRELPAPGVDLMVTALSISQRTGSPLRDLLQRSARLVEQQGEFERMLSVRTAQVRLSIRIVCCLPPLTVAILALISPDFQQGLCSASGIACLVVAAAMDAIALLIIRRIMEGVLG